MLIHEVEQNIPEWYALRAGMPTASMAKSLVTSQGKPSKSLDDYAIQLANDLFSGEPVDQWEGNKHTDRGHELEPVAVSLYSMINNCELQKVGFCTDDDERYGASPDRLKGDDGLVEIKCLSGKYHTKAILYYKKNRKPPTDYVSQAQMQLFTTGKKWVDLFFYHPTLPELTIRILPNKVFFETLQMQLDDVIEKRDEIIKILEAV